MTDLEPPERITATLQRVSAGEQELVEEVFPVIYQELRQLAARHLRRERPGHTLQATALVNEAYLKLVDQRSAKWNDRAHFLALASQAMRRILVDHARRHAAQKRPGVRGKVPLDQAPELGRDPDFSLLELEEALTRLSELDPRPAQVVELRYFGGLTAAEAAVVLGVSEATVAREWRVARAWLRRELSTS